MMLCPRQKEFPIKAVTSSRLAVLAAATMLSACATTGPGANGMSPVAALQAGEWKVTQIAGAPIVRDSQPTLMFGSDGRLGGSASCNRIIVTYTVDGGNLLISPAGATMMACPPAVMEQERRVLDLLPMMTTFSIMSDGSLVLGSLNGQQIVSRR